VISYEERARRSARKARLDAGEIPPEEFTREDFGLMAASTVERLMNSGQLMRVPEELRGDYAVPPQNRRGRR
jgi:hypothetical protein